VLRISCYRAGILHRLTESFGLPLLSESPPI
jgi:hypothetical protein